MGNLIGGILISSKNIAKQQKDDLKGLTFFYALQEH